MEDIQTLTTLINKDFETSLSAENITLDELKEKMKKAIEYLMLYQTERLIQGMYRIDVSETAFREALYQQDADKMVELIIQRELQKVATRKKYSGQ